MIDPVIPPDDSGPEREECVQAMLAHALGMTLSFLAPLLLWLTRGKTSAYVAHHAKESLNLHILLAAALLACWNFAPDDRFALLLSAYFAITTILGVPATIAASQGRLYRYRLPIRLFD